MSRKQKLVWRKLVPLLHPFERYRLTGHRLAKSNAAFAAHRNVENFLITRPVGNNVDVTYLDVLGLIEAKAAVAHEQHIVVEILASRPPVFLLRIWHFRR